jgi:DegV family protein with EDD domain
MAVKVVTNSSADIPQQLAEELGITIVPEYLIFGERCYKDRIDISEEEFYDKLVHGKIQPSTSNPNPQDFLAVYNEVGKNADGIVSLHISTRLSGTVNSAEQAKKLTSAKCPIEIIDSRLVAMPLGMVVIAAARMARAGKGLKEIADASRDMIPRVRLLILFDTLEYLARGGRIGKAKALVGSLLNVKPMLTIKDGEIVPVSQVRSKAKGKEKLLEFYKSLKDIEELCILYSSDREEANELAKSIAGFPTDRIMLARLGPVVGSHAGPGVLAIVARTKN